MERLKIAVLVACFNRVETTLRGLTELRREVDMIPGVSATIFLTDDASPDRTSTLVKAAFPEVEVINGSGSLYWNGGMIKAHEAAVLAGGFDAYLLYNDDVEIGSGALMGFIAEFLKYNSLAPTVMVGAFLSSRTGIQTYSGFVRTSGARILAFESVCPSGEAVPCDTFNGNLVLLPADLFDDLGGLDPRYVHSLGDIDLGLRAKLNGAKIMVHGQFMGVCDRGRTVDELVRGAGLVGRFRLLFRRPNSLGPTLYFAWRHAPRVIWPAYAVHLVLGRITRLLRPQVPGGLVWVRKHASAIRKERLDPQAPLGT